MKRAVLILALFAAASCVDTPTVGEAEQLETGDTDRCDEDGDGSINPACGGCDLDDGDADEGDDPDCGWGCPSSLCYPPPPPVVRTPG